MSVEWNEIFAHVKCNIASYGRSYSHVYFKCDYNGAEFHSATMYPKTAVRLITNKIYFHTVTKNKPHEQQKDTN